jgi:tetratricopeptide (TPR) repeat protein
MTMALKESGRFTGRMLLSALEHIRALHSLPEDLRITREWLYYQALDWGRGALFAFPSLGMSFSPFVLKLSKESAKTGEILLYEAAYVDMLTSRLSGLLMPIEKLESILNECERLLEVPCEEPTIIARRASAYANIARGVGDREARVGYVNKSLDLLNALPEDLDKLRNFAVAVTYPVLGDSLLPIPERIEEARRCLEKSIDLLKRILKEPEKYAADEYLKKYLTLLYGEPREKLELSAMDRLDYAQYTLARVLMNLEQDNARELFKESLDIARQLGKLNNEIASQSMLATFDIIRDGLDAVNRSKSEFAYLWERAKKNIARISPDTHDSVLAEYILSSLISDQKLPDSGVHEFLMGGKIRGVLLGMIYLFEKSYGLEHSTERDEVLQELAVVIGPQSLQGPTTSIGSLSFILLSIINEQFRDARKYAEDASKAGFPPLPYRLFVELREALSEGKLNNKVLETLVKLFYCHI